MEFESLENLSNSKKPRSVKLDSGVSDRLEVVCNHLGMTVNSYLLFVIGSAVSTHEIEFKLTQQDKNQ